MCQITVQQINYIDVDDFASALISFTNFNKNKILIAIQKGQ